MPQELNEKNYRKRTKTPEQALERLMALAARAEKSSGDALRLMRGWGVEPAAQQDVLHKLTEQRFIDDERYSAAFVREKSRLNGWGAYKIRSALSAKGIKREVIERALEQVDSAGAQERLEKMLRTRAARLTGTPYEIKGKLVRYGASLGYDYETVIDQVDRIVKSGG